MLRFHASVSWVALVAVAFLVAFPSGAKSATFVRGDADSSQSLELTDAVQIFGFLFLGSPTAVSCEDALDVDDTGIVEITDGIYLLNYLFLGGSEPPPPFATCGEDLTEDGLTCLQYAPCADSPGLVRSNLERDESPRVAPADGAALVDGNTRFAIDLYHRLREEPGNLFFSPHSISIALAMTYAGAVGNTAEEIGRTLHLDGLGDAVHPSMNWLDLELAARGQGAAGHDGGGFQLRVVNATWGQLGFGFLAPYLDLLAVHYGAGLRTLNFEIEPDASRETINEWVSLQTEQRIQDLLSPGSLDSAPRLVLTNAIYFSAAWEEPFPTQLTQDGEFHLLDGASATVPLMRHRFDVAIAQGDGYQAVELPYDGRELSMVIIVPDEDQFEEFEASLDASVVQAAVDALTPGDVEVTLPRFSCTTSANLVEHLRALGMRDAFSPGVADFSGIDGSRNLYISGVQHQAFVAVDEFGTEAAAATAVVVGIVSLPTQVRVDRPFLFLIRDVETRAILFLGRIVDPRG